MADRMEIQHRIYQFGRAVDRYDPESARSAFWPDAFDNHGVYQGDVDGLFKWIGERHASLEFSYHHVGNIFIEFADDDNAFAESYVFTWQSTAPKQPDGSPGPQMMAAGRYVDHFQRRDGRWRILRRTSFGDSFATVNLADMGGMLAHPGWARGSRDENDPSMVLRRALGL
jgi:hypothetical protein